MSRTYSAVMLVAVLLAATGSFAMADEGAFLGVEVAKLTEAWRSKLGCRGDGVVVLSVEEGSSAEAAGIEEGDVIRKVGDRAATSPGMLQTIIGEKKPNEKVKIGLFRKGKEVTVEATLKGRPGVLNELPGRVKRFFYMPEEGEGTLRIDPGSSSEGSNKWIGVRLEKVTGQLAKHFGVDSGLLIAEVVSGAPAEKAGLKAGDVILEADGAAVEDVQALRNVVTAKKADEVVKLKIVRNGKEMTSDVPVEENSNIETERKDLRTWFRDLQDRLGSPPGMRRWGSKHEHHGDKSCEDGTCSDGPGGVWGAQGELQTQIEELRERLEKVEKELAELRGKKEKK